ncbi:MAG TPA: ATP-binding protein [Anaerolineales bacterium]|nr:ATP-binding protein [Anaerolineales bacterium]
MTEPVQSLTQLLERASARRFLEAPPPEDLGLAEHLVFPFLALVGQYEMKLALLLTVINPFVGGVLLLGPRGTGKTTAARSLADLLPDVPRSRCTYGCLPEDIETGGLDAVCPECAQRYGEGEPLTYMDRVRLVELPLNARLEDVVGGLDERAAVHNRMRLNRGILSRADRNLLYVDEINLLVDDIVDAILDAASQGTYSVHRGPVSATYRARFVLIGSMNPEEGRLRPQILDRFGLRVVTRGLAAKEERLEAYRRSIAYHSNPRRVVLDYAETLERMRLEVVAAREALPSVRLSPQAERVGLRIIQSLGIDSLRAEITLFEAARAHAVADGRDQASPADIRAVAPMTLRLRRSAFMQDFFHNQAREETELRRLIGAADGRRRKKAPARRKRG